MPSKFKPMKQRMRASFAAGAADAPRFEKIDKEAEVLHGVQITLEGEAKGHGVWLDRAFCEDVANAGNATGDAGVKVRFGHPAMCSDALGTYLGRAKNFRVVDLKRKDGDGEAVAGVLADVHIASESHSAPSGDLGKWVLEAAENSPDTFGQSIVFTYADWKVKDADGNDHSYRSEVMGVDADGNDIVDEKGKKKPTMKGKDWEAQSADGKVYAVLGKLHGTDFTDTPAATDGVFSATDLASEAEAMLDEHPEIADTLAAHPEKALEFLDRMGLMETLQNARLSGLQAAKDKEIAEMKKELDKAILDTVNYGEVVKERDALKAEIENLKSMHQSDTEALDKANAEIKQLRDSLSTTESDLAETREHLAAWKSHASGHGASVNTPPGGDLFADFPEAVAKLGYEAAARRYPDMLAAYKQKKRKGK